MTNMQANSEDEINLTLTRQEISFIQVALEDKKEHYLDLVNKRESNPESAQHFDAVAGGFADVKHKINRMVKSGGVSNGWHPASEKPTAFPVLTINRSGHLDVMHKPYDKSWACVAEFYSLVQWQAVELPHDVFGHAVAAGITLD